MNRAKLNVSYYYVVCLPCLLRVKRVNRSHQTPLRFTWSSFKTSLESNCVDFKSFAHPDGYLDNVDHMYLTEAGSSLETRVATIEWRPTIK